LSAAAAAFRLVERTVDASPFREVAWARGGSKGGTVETDPLHNDRDVQRCVDEAAITRLLYVYALMVLTDGVFEINSSGVYRDHYVRTAAGWRFAGHEIMRLRQEGIVPNAFRPAPIAADAR
jgi:hypothetical protein